MSAFDPSATPADDLSVVVALLDVPTAEQLAQVLSTLAGLPVSEVLALCAAEPTPALRSAASASGQQPRVRFLRMQRPIEAGARSRVLLREARERGHDRVVLAHPEAVRRDAIERVLAADPDAVVLSGASRRRLVTRLLNVMLGLDLDDYRAPVRAVPGHLLEVIPFESCSDDARFDLELLIQARAAHAQIVQLPGSGDPLPAPARFVGAAVAYRLHQLHLIRRGRFIVQPPVRYAFKSGPYSSHRQIVEMVRPDSQVLDLGCSQGLLAGPLFERGCQVTGVDVLPREFVSRLLADYHQLDLTRLEELKLDRSYDTLLFADVLEHLLTPEEALRAARRHLAPDGRLIASTGNVAIWFYRLSLLLGRFEYGPRGILDETHVHLYTLSTFRRLIAAAGFRIVGERHTGLPFELVFESTGRSRWVRALAHAYQLLVRLWPAMFAYQVILEAELDSVEDPAAREAGG